MENKQLVSFSLTNWHTSLNLIHRDFFIHSGVGAMEIVAMDMKLRGMYIARQLSFKGVTFKVEEVPLTNEFKQTYNDAVQLVSHHQLFHVKRRS